MQSAVVTAYRLDYSRKEADTQKNDDPVPVFFLESASPVGCRRN
jgi:hypothetical protein